MGAAKDKVRQLFQYLAKVQEGRSSPKRTVDYEWAMYLDQLPNHPSISIHGKQKDQSDDNVIICVIRPPETTCPAPPAVLREWVCGRWRDLSETPTYLPSINRTTSKAATTEQFDDVPARVTAWRQWLGKRQEWVNAEKPNREASRVFQRLFALRGQLERDAEKYQLVLGDGFLKIKDANGIIDHPLLLQKVELQFDPSVPEFRIVEADDPSELFTTLLGLAPAADVSHLSGCRDDLVKGAYHPLGQADTDGFLSRVVQTVFANGRLVPRAEATDERESPVVYRRPVLYLAPRTAGLTNAIEAVIKRLNRSDSDEDVSPVLSRVVGIPADPQREQIEWTNPEQPQPNLPKKEIDLLLTMRANPKQESIIEQLSANGSVLVQGPPGTGKTHTIANIVGHLLAHGKSILITSHTAKALRVVREKIAPELRPMCVSVLDTDLTQRKELEESITGIVGRLSSCNPEQLDRKALEFVRERQELKSRIREVQSKINRAVKDEYDSIVVGGESYAPSDAARNVRSGRGKLDWIPGPVRPGECLPLSESDIEELYNLNRLLAVEDERRLSGRLPELAEVPTPDDFRSLADRIQSLRSADCRVDTRLWHGNTSVTVTELQTLNSILTTVLAAFDNEEPWVRECVEAGCCPHQKELWEELIALIDQTHNKVAELRPRLIRNDVSIVLEGSVGELSQACSEILRRLRSGGTLRLMQIPFLKPQWKCLLKNVRVNGQPPHSLSDFEAVEAWFAIREAREFLVQRWERQVGRYGVPVGESLGENPEQYCQQFTLRFRTFLDWHDRNWLPCLETLNRIGVSWDLLQVHVSPLSGPAPITRRIERIIREHVQPMAERQQRFRTLTDLTQVHESLIRKLASYSSEANFNLFVSDFFDIVKSLDVEEYAVAWCRLRDLASVRERYTRRRILLSKLEPSAPTWAKAISLRTAPHDGQAPPRESPAQAWVHRQFVEELERRESNDVERLQVELSRLDARFRDVTTKLVDCRAWAAQHRRTGLTQQLALRGWLDITRKRGFNSGVRSAVLKAAARKKLDSCREAVPVWIMPLSRVADCFDFKTTNFDVVIIDEASQSDVTGLLAFALAREVVVVGDDQQVSPAAVGQSLQELQLLIDQYLDGIPNKELYDGRTSLYDLASASFVGGIIRLVEHFRCVPEIIQFSNELCYGGEIKPLRESSSVLTRPFIVEHRVADGECRNQVNQREAQEVASLLIASHEQPEYADKTMGVISMSGEEQAKQIDSLLRQRLDLSSYAKRRIVCGNPAQFQGDERHVIFLSMVDAALAGQTLPRRRDDDWKRRFNVAASRASDQLWVVHSLNRATDLQPDDLRDRLIRHAEDPYASTLALKAGMQDAESEFERQVLKHLHQKGYRAHSQWRVGAFSIDIVVEGTESRRIAIECDGDRYHTLETLSDDMSRQAILERLGWKFIRIRGTSFFRDPSAAMASVYETLEQRGIEPIGATLMAADERADEQELRRRIVSRAAILRQLWTEASRPQRQEAASSLDQHCSPASAIPCASRKQAVLFQ